jgi:hypothetical protein
MVRLNRNCQYCRATQLDSSKVVTYASTTAEYSSELGFRIRGDGRPRICSRTPAMVSLQSVPFPASLRHRGVDSPIPSKIPSACRALLFATQVVHPRSLPGIGAVHKIAAGSSARLPKQQRASRRGGSQAVGRSPTPRPRETPEVHGRTCGPSPSRFRSARRPSQACRDAFGRSVRRRT